MMKMKRLYCRCIKTLTVRNAVKEVKAEIVELWYAPTSEFADEWSDVWFGIGRLAGAIVGMPMVRMPWIRRHVEKIDRRMSSYECVRSKRHLVDGRCPSEGK